MKLTGKKIKSMLLCMMLTMAMAITAVGCGSKTEGTADAQKTMESQETESMQNREGEQKAEADTDETNSNKENVKETAAQPDEAQTYLKQGYYVVRQGDNLAAICRKIYQTTAMMDKVCEANGIDDPDAIYAGQYLTLPN